MEGLLNKLQFLCISLTSGDLAHILKDMVEKGLERESDEVIVGENPTD